MIAPTVVVSDHALVRYLERVKGVDVEGARARLCPGATNRILIAHLQQSAGIDIAAARAEIVAITGVPAALGATVVARDGYPYLISDYTVTTVLPKGGRPAPRSLPKRDLYPVAGR